MYDGSAQSSGNAGLHRIAVSARRSGSDGNARPSHAANTTLIFNLDHSVGG